jgi:hypothetical protein
MVTMAKLSGRNKTVRIAMASVQERQAIGTIRHDVYARELKQHPEHPEGILTDNLDGVFIRDLSELSPMLGSYAVRIAVKDSAANYRVVAILRQVLQRGHYHEGGLHEQ